ncbi:hypothetical protein [Pseudomonas anguilliseptica]|uniref:hypothetical protein n=1 Tax=Pseudomonas anguilliseptica TaxID=53406 RepID=UPI00325A4EB3
MGLSEAVGGALGLLVLGALAMTQAPKEWQTTGGWLLFSLVGIPLFGIVIALMVKVPVLMFGAVAWACFHGGRR